MSRRVAVVIASRANYGRSKSLLLALRDHPRVELALVVAASALDTAQGDVSGQIRADGLPISRQIQHLVVGDSPLAMARSLGLGVLDYSQAFDEMQPDFVLVIGDRFEVFAPACAAAYLGLALVHLQGGEISGNLDDRVRHAISKLADFHLVTTQQSRDRLLHQGESPERVFLCGCPCIDLARAVAEQTRPPALSDYQPLLGRGKPDWQRPYLLLCQHPETTRHERSATQIAESLAALGQFDAMQKIVILPNGDAGRQAMLDEMEGFIGNSAAGNFYLFASLAPEDYLRCLNGARCAIGNSSSLLREALYLGVPSVVVGQRQANRERGRNALWVDTERQAIARAIQQQLDHGRYACDPRYGNGHAADAICSLLTRFQPTPLKPRPGNAATAVDSQVDKKVG